MAQKDTYTYSEVEAIVDIALVAGELLTQERFEVLDSRELISFIADAGKRFEKDFAKRVNRSVEPDDYMSMIEHFAYHELMTTYPSSYEAEQAEHAKQP